MYKTIFKLTIIIILLIIAYSVGKLSFEYILYQNNYVIPLEIESTKIQNYLNNHYINFEYLKFRNWMEDSDLNYNATDYIIIRKNNSKDIPDLELQISTITKDFNTSCVKESTNNSIQLIKENSLFPEYLKYNQNINTQDISLIISISIKKCYIGG